jgi:hypothetical protein
LAGTQQSLRTASNRHSCPGNRGKPAANYFTSNVRQDAAKTLAKGFNAALRRVKLGSFAATEPKVFCQAPPPRFRAPSKVFTGPTKNTRCAKKLGSAFDAPTRNRCQPPCNTLAKGKRSCNATLTFYKGALALDALSDFPFIFSQPPGQSLR